MDQPDTGPEAIRPRPDYPPKTPPPPKKPPSPPPPQTSAGSVPVRLDAARGRRVMSNRQGANWTLEAQPWAARKAVEEVSERLAKWGLRAPKALAEVVLFLVGAVVADGGRHISLHLAEQDDQALVLALSHRPDAVELGETVLLRLHELGAVSCGTEVTGEGRRLWALLDLAS